LKLLPMPSDMQAPKQKKQASADIESPCVRNCCLDYNDVCLGCYRHLDEITGWREFSDEEKRRVLRHCQERKQALKR